MKKKKKWFQFLKPPTQNTVGYCMLLLFFFQRKNPVLRRYFRAKTKLEKKNP